MPDPKEPVAPPIVPPVTPPAVPPVTPPVEPPVTPPVTPPATPPDVPPVTPPVPAPVDYTVLKLPEGSTLPAGFLEGEVAIAKGLGLSTEEAQLYVTQRAEVENARAASVKASQDAQINQWAVEASKDSEIGGADFVKNVALASRVLNRFNPTLAQELKKTGLENHPELVRTFVRIGKSMSEDVLVGASGTPIPQSKSLTDIFYPKKEAVSK